jgi:hypothetical protein
MDNLNIHGRKSLSDVFGEEMAAEVWSRFTVRFVRRPPRPLQLPLRSGSTSRFQIPDSQTTKQGSQ